jgi:DnaJ family protein A protein 2
MKNGQKITFTGDADEAPDTITGNVHFIIKQKDHAIFRRVENDLHINTKILLSEALCGYQFVVRHLDGRTLIINSAPKEVIKPGTGAVVFQLNN